MSLVNEMAYYEQPYEKCRKYGASALTDTELLAVFIRTGLKGKSCLLIARELLGENEDEKALLRIVSRSIEELTKFDGIGEVKAIQLVCMLELSKRLWRMNLNNANVFTDPDSIAAYYMEEMRHLKTESVRMMLLNTKGALIKDLPVSTGTVNASVVSPREIFINALKYEAVNIALVHNHPSGDPSPSAEDLKITSEVERAGEFMGIRLIDHIIIGDNRYVSLAREGKIQLF